MSQELYLVFPDEQTAQSVLTRTEGAVEADPENGIDAVEGYQVPNYQNIDTIGVMYDETDPENPVALEGWHVNVLLLDGEDTGALEEYAIPEPSTPLRKWKTEVSA